jgi:predicted ArsR family transcriptional regulator
MPGILNTLAGETQVKLLHLLRRAPRTITELSLELGLTDNAIRTHIAALTRDGLVELVGTQRDTGGKPARQYGLTGVGGELFPKAYAVALGGLVDEIVRVEGQERAIALLQGVGSRVAQGVPPAADLAGRVTAAANTLRDLGADIDVKHDGLRTGILFESGKFLADELAQRLFVRLGLAVGMGLLADLLLALL